MKRVGLVEARECGYDNAPATVLREETPKVDAAATSPVGKKLLHRISPRCILSSLSRRCDDAYSITYLGAPGHLSTPITDFGKGRAIVVVVVVVVVSLSSSSYRLQRAKPVRPRRCHRGNARWKLARISHCSSEWLHRAAPNRIEPRVSRSILLSRLFRRASREFSERLSSLFYGVASFSKRHTVL